MKNIEQRKMSVEEEHLKSVWWGKELNRVQLKSSQLL